VEFLLVSTPINHSNLIECAGILLVIAANQSIRKLPVYPSEMIGGNQEIGQP